jgi:hypothetical protein
MAYRHMVKTPGDMAMWTPMPLNDKTIAAAGRRALMQTVGRLSGSHAPDGSARAFVHG